MTDLDLDQLMADYTPEPIPSCRVCGGALGIAQIGGGRPTVWACGAAGGDSEHYMRSQHIARKAGDVRVVELVTRYRALLEEKATGERDAPAAFLDPAGNDLFLPGFLTPESEARMVPLYRETQPPAGPDERSLAERMEAAGMLTVAQLLAGAPLDAFVKHVGVRDLDTFAQWLEMRRKEALTLQSRLTLDGRTDDELYEWVVAHAAAFGEAHVNFKAVVGGRLSGLPLCDEPVAWECRALHGDDTPTPGWGPWEPVVPRNSYSGETVATRVAELQHYIESGYHYELRALYATAPGARPAANREASDD